MVRILKDLDTTWVSYSNMDTTTIQYLDTEIYGVQIDIWEKF